MAIINDWLKAKYTDRDDEDDRFKDEIGEYHASRTGRCPRRWYWDFNKQTEDSWSPYFELGNVFEGIYGDALKWKFGEERVKQDVMIRIILEDDIELVGESDWTVFVTDAERVEEVVLDKRGDEEERWAVNEDGEEVDYNGNVMKVIETKTTKKIEWREKYGYKPKHLYQLQSYMWAMDAHGEIVYMTRNELDEKVFEFGRNPKVEMDIELRVRNHDEALKTDEVPGTDPLEERACKYCPYKDDCKATGGERWS